MSIEEKVKDIITSQLCVEGKDVVLKANLVDDLDADSLDLVGLIMEIEEQFDIEIADEVAEKATIVKDVVDGVNGMV